MNLDKYTESDFIRDPLVPEVGEGGLAELLISQSLISPYTDGADLSSSVYSWPYIESMSADKWNRESQGNIGPGFVVGVKVMFLDTTGENNRRSFQLCNSLALTINAGDTAQTLILDIEERQFYKGSVYFKVKDYPLLGTSNATFVFRKDGNDNFDGYSCNGSGNNSPITFVVEPYFSAEENSIFNPLYNNVVEGVLSTIARKVEPNKSFASLWGASRIFDGEDADASASSGPNGAAASWSSTDPVDIVDGGHMTTYPVPILVQPAEIPDYFYTALASISGRFLGSKTGYESKAKRLSPDITTRAVGSTVSSSGIIKEFISNYTGNYVLEGASTSIRKLTKDTLEIVAAHTSSDLTSSILPQILDPDSGSLISPGKTCSFVELGVDPAFFAVQEFQGSVYSVDAKNVPDIKDMEFDSVKFVPGTIYEHVSGSDSASTVNLDYGRTYIKNHNSVTGQSGSVVENHAASLPILGDVIYSKNLEKRHINARIFIQETGQVLTTNEFASVINISTVSSSVEP